MERYRTPKSKQRLPLARSSERTGRDRAYDHACGIQRPLRAKSVRLRRRVTPGHARGRLSAARHCPTPRLATLLQPHVAPQPGSRRYSMPVATDFSRVGWHLVALGSTA
jgi:hypothetical protein